MSTTKINKAQAGDGIWTSDNLVAGTNISITQVPQPVIDENTLGVWHFENGFDNAVSGSNYQITTADANFTSDYKKFGSYSQYDNKGSQYVFFPGKAFSNNFTLDFWAAPGTWTSRYIGLNTNGTAGSNRAYNGPFFVGLQGDSTSASISFNTISSSGTNVVTVTPNSWHHIAMEIENGTGRIYLDGELKYTTTGLNSSYYIHNSQTSGSGGSGIAQPKIDELRLSNIARYNGQNFTPFTQPYAASAGPAQYAINNTKADPDLSSYLKNTATGTDGLTISGTAETNTRGTNIGVGSSISGNSSTAIGANSYASGANAVVIGSGTSSNRPTAYNSCVAIGSVAKATVTGSIAVGSGSYCNSGTHSVTVGTESRATGSSSTTLGSYARSTGTGSIAIGSATGSSSDVYTNSSAEYSIAIGYNSKATASSAIQLGSGTNNTASTFQVFNYQLLDANGKIPSARLEVTRQKYTNVTGTTLATGLTLANYSTILVYKNGMLFDETDDYTISTNNIEFNVALESTDKINIIAM